MAPYLLCVRGYLFVDDRPLGWPVSGYLIVGTMRDEEHQGDRFQATTLEMAAAIVADLLRRGYAWVHVDNLEMLEGGLRPVR